MSWRYKARHERGPHDSSSCFGQMVHNTITTGFNFVDTDRYVWIPDRSGRSSAFLSHSRKTGVLRHIEQFPSGGGMGAAELEVYPMIAALYQHGLEHKIIAPGSGLFTVESDYPYERGVVHEFVWSPTGHCGERNRREMEGHEFVRFIGADSPDVRKKAA